MAPTAKSYNPESDGEVEYHDEIHEALHRDARVDYTKPIIRNGLIPRI
jgi:hypothetical protein